MSLMELFSNYTPKTTHREAETEKGNSGNSPVTVAVTALGFAIASSNSGNSGNSGNSDNRVTEVKITKVYRYRLKDNPNSELIVIMPNSELSEAVETLKMKFGDRLLSVEVLK